MRMKCDGWRVACGGRRVLVFPATHHMCDEWRVAWGGRGAHVCLATHHTPPATRVAFTLVEMMVAMTLTIFVMVILSQCFIQGLETFSGLKVIGDMNEQFRSATSLLRADLSQDHFEAGRRLSDPLATFTSNPPRMGFFVVGQGYPNPTYPTTKTTEVPAGIDPDGVGSTRAYDHWLHFTVKMRGNAREKLFSAVDLTPFPYPPVGKPFQPLANPAVGGNLITSTYFNQSPDAVFADPAQTRIYFSPWAEVAWYMVPTGTTQSPQVPPTLVPPGVPAATPTPLFALYRCQYLVFPNTSTDQPPPLTVPVTVAPNTKGSAKPALMSPQYFQTFSCIPTVAPAPAAPTTGNIKFFNPSDLANGYYIPQAGPLPPIQNRAFLPFTELPPAPGSVPRASTLVLSNVVSFQIEILPTFGSAFGDMAVPPMSYVAPDPDAPGVKAGPYSIPYDTANFLSTRLPMPKPPYFPNNVAKSIMPPAPTFTIQGLQITIRIWDPKSQTTRQTTIVQDM